jgi:thiol:disulfide interchange protein DsbC
MVLLFLLASGTYTSLSLAESRRWYSTDQVKVGKSLFAQNCASCHGKNAEGTTDWKKRDAKGNLVPPPLNGTAHAWHHPMKVLRMTIKQGGKPLGGQMPPFADKLGEYEIDSIIAWFQSKWSDEIYAAWSERNQSTGFVPVKKQKQEKTADPQTRLLRNRLPGVDVGPATRTPVEGLYQSKVGADYAYLFSNGRYALVGELIDLQTGNNLTEQAKGKDNLELLNTISESDMVVFPAKGQEKHAITVFTDTECPFCRKLHAEVPQLQAAGIKVRYIPFPRNGPAGASYESMKSVWCAKDRQKAMSIAKGITEGVLPKPGCPEARAVDQGFALGIKIEIRGTPAIFLPTGRLLEGYVPAKELVQLLNAASEGT